MQHSFVISLANHSQLDCHHGTGRKFILLSVQHLPAALVDNAAVVVLSCPELLSVRVCQHRHAHKAALFTACDLIWHGD